MEEKEFIARIDRFERTVATCASVVPVLFSGQCLLASLSAPFCAAMFADFGGKLPVSTQFVLSTWPVWAVFAVGVPIATVTVAWKARPTFSVIFSTVAGVVTFAVAQVVLLSLWLPIFQLAAVVSGK